MTKQNYNKMSAVKPKDEILSAPVNAEIKPETETTEKVQTSEEMKIVGTVYGCERLNVRALPSKTSEVVTEIRKETTVDIIEDGSTDDFYRIKLPGVEGFCMKRYIKVDKK